MKANNIFRYIIDYSPTSMFVYLFCSHYFKRYNSANKGDIRSNGELRCLQEVLTILHDHFRCRGKCRRMDGAGFGDRRYSNNSVFRAKRGRLLAAAIPGV